MRLFCFPVKKEIKYCLFFLGLTAFGLFFTERLTFAPTYSTYTDTFSLYGLHTLTDPALFPGDPAADLFRRMAAAPGAGDLLLLSLYKALLPLAGLPWSAKIISLLSVFLSAFLIYQAGLRMKFRTDTAFLLAAFHTIYFFSTDFFYFGQFRTLGALLNSLLLYVLCSEKYVLVPFFVPLFYIAYPYPAFSAAILALALPVFRRKEIGGSARAYSLALGLSAALTVLPGIEGVSAFIQARGQYKLLSPGGAPIDLNNAAGIILDFIFNINEHGRLYLIFTALFLAAILLKLLRSGPRGFEPVSRALGPALAASLAGFSLLYFMNPLFAARQLAFLLPSAVSLAAALASAELIGERKSWALPWLAAIIFVSLHPFYNKVRDFSGFRGLYEHIGRLPAGSLLAGDPESKVCAGVPFYAKRKVFYSDKIAIFTVIFNDYEINRRREAMLGALCSGSAAGAGRIAHDRGFTHFLVEERFYSGSAARCRSAGRTEGPYPVLEAARLNPDFRLKLPEGDIFVITAEKISATAGYLRRTH